MHGMSFAMLTPMLYISVCRKICGVIRGNGFAHVRMVSSIALDYVYCTYCACGKVYEATHKRHYQFSHFHGACWEEDRGCPHVSLWGSKWGDGSHMVSSNCVLNHMLIPGMSEILCLCEYLELGNIFIFLTSFHAHFCILYMLNWSANSKVPRDS